jgi:hypothetical protein
VRMRCLSPPKICRLGATKLPWRQLLFRDGRFGPLPVQHAGLVDNKVVSGIPCYLCVVKRNEEQACDAIRFGV